jgi:hypothetical protein
MALLCGTIRDGCFVWISVASDKRLMPRYVGESVRFIVLEIAGDYTSRLGRGEFNQLDGRWAAQSGPDSGHVFVSSERRLQAADPVLLS